MTNCDLSSDDDAAWQSHRAHWKLRSDTIYLNHGSFGPPPLPVIAAQREWKRRLDEQPIDFFVRQYEPAWLAARERLAEFIGTAADNLVFVENATAGMNVVADNFSLRPGDEVLLTDHEYGAVERNWQRACRRAGAVPPVIATLPLPLESAEQVVDTLFAAATDRTRLIVVSHITSPTAVILPIQQICDRARQRGIAVCIDGPHAPAQAPLAIDQLGCDFYTASCHKWLSAPFGSGFLYVAPKHQSTIEPPALSWGRLLPQRPESWFDEFIWSGTRDPSAYFAIPAAIDFLRSIGEDQFRARTHELARYARQRLVELTRLEPIVPDSPDWYGSMTLVPLPPSDKWWLQEQLWRRFGIEVPIIEWRGRQFIRVSCHIYNSSGEIDALLRALAPLLDPLAQHAV